MGKFKRQQPDVMEQTREPPTWKIDILLQCLLLTNLKFLKWRPETMTKTGRNRKAK
jgi:hypothetical protein